MWYQPCKRLSTPLRWIFTKQKQKRCKKLVTHVESHASAVSLLKRAENSDHQIKKIEVIVQELCESRGGRPGLPVLTSLPVSVDVKLY